MSRSKRGKKAPGWEHWSRRPNSMSPPGRVSKTRTHRLERIENKKIIKKQLDDE